MKITPAEIKEILGHPIVKQWRDLSPSAAIYRLEPTASVLDVEYVAEESDIKAYITKEGIASFRYVK